MSDAPYPALADRLGDLGGRVVALPDGSVDTYYRVFEGRRRGVDSREALGDRIASSRASSFQVTAETREPGGQAVNAARQAGALGADVTLFGHLDDPVFDSLAVETRSLGDPAAVSVFTFDDGDLMLSEESGDLLSWSLADLRRVRGAASTLDAADVVCCGNWVSIPGMDDALRDLGPLVGDATVVFDPGDVTGCDAAVLVTMVESIAALAGSTPVVLSVNAAEADRVADALGAPGGPIAERLGAVRDRADLAAAVVHEADRAVVADGAGVRSVRNASTDHAVRRTGAGDRFDGGLAVGLASGLAIDPALALGNACASHYVGTGDTADAADLRPIVRDMS